MQLNPIPPIVWILVTSAGLVLFPASLHAQVGGGVEQIFQWNGTAAADRMGEVVANAGDVNGDGVNDILVNAPGVDSTWGSQAGAVYVFSGLDGSLLHQWGGGNSYQFGNAVAGAGDVNGDGFDDIIIGSSADYSGLARNVGSAFVHSGFDGSLLYHWRGTNAYDHFGVSVAGAGDVNGDGFDDVLVGAVIGGTSYIGAAFVYSGATGTLLYQWSGAVSHARLGGSVAGLGDIDGDGFSDVGIGETGTYGGSVFVYSGQTGALIFLLQGSAVGDRFGSSVSSGGDVNADGVNDIIVGAYNASGFIFTEVGYASVYSGATGNLLFRWDGTIDDAGFGNSVSGAGDVDGDGFQDLLVGANRAVIVGEWGHGSAFLYSGRTGSLLYRWDGIEANDFLGTSVAGVGDINGDGLCDFVIGAYGTTLGWMPYTGSAYAFSFEPFLHPSSYSISAALGGTLDLEIDFPSSASNDKYRILISASGTGPTNYGVDIPLTQDTMVIQTFRGIYPFSTYSNLHGTLGLYGYAIASITFPPGMRPSLVGRTFWLAAIANQPGLLPEYSSIAIPIEITP